MNSIVGDDLALDGVEYGDSTQWTLRSFLYSGGAATRVKVVDKLISDGSLGEPMAERRQLIEQLHDEISGRIAEGMSLYGIYTGLDALRRFYAWADRVGRSPTLMSVEEDFVAFTDFLIQRVRIAKDLSESACETYATAVATHLNKVLGRKNSLLETTKIHSLKNRPRAALGTQAAKQNLETTFEFGQALLDVSDALTLDAIRGPLPVTIHLRKGPIIKRWCRLLPPEKLLSLREDAQPHQKKKVMARRARRAADTSNRCRHSVINLRIEAELLIFISQTGMNFTQASRLADSQYRYQAYFDGYKVYRVYKGRRAGEVSFQIYSEYRPLFERYLDWRNSVFGGGERLLFPFIAQPGKKRGERSPQEFIGVKRLCKDSGLRYVGPRMLRGLRVNWFSRRSRDPSMTAEAHQHSQETLFRHYDQPHHQVAAVEISRFHAAQEPIIEMPGPGACSEPVPSQIATAPPFGDPTGLHK